MNIYKIAPSIVIGSLTGILSYYGYKTVQKYYHIYNMISNIKVNDDKPSVILEDSHMIINYVYLNDTYTLRVPYNQDMVATMAQYEVYGIKENGEEVKLTQQPGIPYLVSPFDMKVEKIIVYDLGEDEQREYYHIPPFYGSVEE